VEGPFFEDFNLKMQYHHLHTPLPALRDYLSTIPSIVEYVVLKALAKDPRDRWDSIQAFAIALEQASQQTSVSAVTSSLRSSSLHSSEQPAPLSESATVDYATSEGEDGPSTK
jgi:hypothetical protein